MSWGKNNPQGALLFSNQKGRMKTLCPPIFRLSLARSPPCHNNICPCQKIATDIAWEAVADAGDLAVLGVLHAEGFNIMFNSIHV